MQGVETFLRSSIRACLGRVMSTMEQFVLKLILLAGNLYAVCMLVKKIVSTVAHLFGCIGPGSQQSWQDACMWACCGTIRSNLSGFIQNMTGLFLRYDRVFANLQI